MFWRSPLWQIIMSPFPKEGFADMYFSDGEKEPKMGGPVLSDQDPPVPL